MVSASIHASFWEQMKSLIPSHEWDQFVASFDREPPVSIRLNPAKPIDIEYPVSNPVPWESNAFYLQERPLFTLDPGFHGGAYYVQEAASMILRSMFEAHVDPEIPIAALDLCAAPGGKSTHLLDLLSPQSILVSNEIVPSRFEALNENLVRWGRHNMIRTLTSPSKLRQSGQLFDLILVDAPCSGEGMMRKDPQAVTHWSMANIEKCFTRQQEILSEAMQMLAPGGLLLYSTCTYNTIENEGIGDWLLANYDIESLACSNVTSWGFEERKGKATNAYVAYAHLVQGEGICMQAFRKGGKTPSLRVNNNVSKQAEKLLQSLLPFVAIDAQQDVILSSKEKFYQFPIAWKNVFDSLVQKIPGALPGICLGQFKGASWIPDHEHALMAHVAHKMPNLSLSLRDERRFLKGEVLDASQDDIPNGWTLIMHQAIPLGWGKKVGNRINNYYPTKSRIKMALPED